ncbi:neutral/alkaline non-lysosomal ceramidase N-terminal domain-containing protein [Thermococcus aggregans]|uniref:Neutral/alkaline non-lysosomal ceramidase N-terminal domain-containing protein n=1 Tax=Thermococcus aggregans TaxID=110163 RepID=A0A9E7MWH0_THEAG|nr:neutral/alkaline non-lysosomal ceramidase N-terminal domain-containing protein [Thermococcus aggregans]USS40138.1 neutral/alkaline non-lysosomal ceramidase N-terminal domain-containing protein [Thermococcus aggregans]
MKIGWAKVDITPENPMPLAGYALRTGRSSDILDRIYGRILYIDSVVIIALDLLIVDEKLREEIALKVSKELGIPESNVIVTATHTHSAPESSLSFLTNLWGIEDEREIIKNYQEFIITRLAEALKKINFDNTSLFAGKAIIEGVSSNRIDPNGIVDKESVFLFDSKKKTIALNFSCHPTVLPYSNNKISGDLAGAISRLFEKEFNVALFLNGAAGNVSTRFTRKSQKYEEVNRLAKLFFSQVKNKLNSCEKLTGDVDLTWKKLKVKPKQPPSRTKIEDFEAELLAKLNQSNISSQERRIIENNLLGVQILKKISEYLKKINVINFNIAKLTIGENFVALFTPAEMFVEYQITAKRISPYKYTMFVGYANGYTAYIPFEPLKEDTYEVAVSIVDPSEYQRIKGTIEKLLTK